MKIREMTESDLPLVKSFTDEFIGQGYFEVEELKEIYKLSSKDGHCASLVALDKETQELLGVRLTYAPGMWLDKGRGLTTEKWKVAADTVGYFKSLFVHSKAQGRGVGRSLSNQAIAILLQMGAQAVVCHSWLESPRNSSQKYLNKMGFEEVQEHPLFWSHIDYECTRCGKGACQCTASEMILYI